MNSRDCADESAPTDGNEKKAARPEKVRIAGLPGKSGSRSIFWHRLLGINRKMDKNDYETYSFPNHKNQPCFVAATE